MQKINRVSVVVAHADDEVIGCGGTIKKLSENGSFIQLIVVADGESSRDKILNSAIENRKISCEKSSKILGIQDVVHLGLKDNRLDQYSCFDIVQLIVPHINKFKPDTLITHCSGDVNIDHRVVHECCLVITRPEPSNIIKNTLFFEVASSTDWAFRGNHSHFSPNFFVDISNQADIKSQALECYASEIRQSPHSRSFEGIISKDNSRGYQIGVKKAEAFQVGRIIHKEEIKEVR